jgi:hypothetical protein
LLAVAAALGEFAFRRPLGLTFSFIHHFGQSEAAACASCTGSLLAAIAFALQAKVFAEYSAWTTAG